MYINYVNDRKQLGYKVVKDRNDGIKLVLITESSVVFVKNVSLNLKNKSKRIFIVVTLVGGVYFSNIQSSKAMGLPMPPSSHYSLSVHEENSSQIPTESKIPMNVEQEPKIVLIRSKRDLRNPDWLKEFISSISGGAQDQELDNKLIESIISKLSNSSLSNQSINKFLMKFANAACSGLSNQDLLRILAELEKPFRYDPFSGIPRAVSFDILGLPEAVLNLQLLAYRLINND